MKKRVIAILLTAALVLGLVACGGKGNDPAVTGGAKTGKAAISGVADKSVPAGTVFDALEGVTAKDGDGKDITGKITVESTPKLTFLNGKATPEAAGNYELVYSVKGDGENVEAYATLTVTKKTGEAEVYREFDFSTREVTNNRGWEARIGESAKATAELKDGAYVIEIKNPGNGDGDVQLAKKNFELKDADYRIKVWAKATKPTYAHIIARDENAEGWSTFGGGFNLVIGEKIAPLVIDFSAKGGSAELLINLGKITPNPDNAGDTTPEDFTVTIDKIELYEIVGEEDKVPVYTADLTKEGSVAASAGDGAEASIKNEDGKAVLTVGKYPTEGGVWSVKADIALPGVTIVKGEKYYYSFKLNAKNGQSGEALVESAEKGWENRANFNGLGAAAGEDVIVEAAFTAEADVNDPVIRLQIGNAPEGAADNIITISDIVFGKLEGDKETKKTTDAFTALGRVSGNGEDATIPWETFNGTDEDNEKGVGTIWMKDGSLFYRIDDGGTVDWHNKLICGFTGNPLNLESDSYYTIEVTAKADKNVSCGVFLNPMGGWDPRIAEGMDITTEFKTFSFSTTETFITDMAFELLFQFGSEATAALGDVTVEFKEVKIIRTKALN
ncbi:MAG: hypothetical protein J6U10_09455 [Lachnospiraceae bacterium]|nr:hypothetical protein [Lachnospiraceae bacterium]MBP5184139.1 hypothetical protein [Lachnospiraceae bacterium]